MINEFTSLASGGLLAYFESIGVEFAGLMISGFLLFWINISISSIESCREDFTHHE